MYGTEHENTIDGEVTDMVVTRNQAQISVRHEMSPDSLRAEIQRQSEMQQIMTEYVRDAMVKDHHYYSFNEGGKPSLTKDGAFRICSLFKITPGPVDIEIIREDGDHFTVISTARLFNQDGVEIASSRGSASTRESKYAYRWVNEGQVPADIDKASLKTRGGQNKNGGSWKQYQLPNPDKADLENTILKMSEKRATVGAVNKLPLVSELFAADPDDGTPESQPQKRNARPAAEKPKATEPPSPASIERAVNLSTKLQKEYSVSADDLAALLPDGVGKFSDLSESQALAVLPSLTDLINAKLAEAKAAK